jgi:hypothetical protein
MIGKISSLHIHRGDEEAGASDVLLLCVYATTALGYYAVLGMKNWPLPYGLAGRK